MKTNKDSRYKGKQNLLIYFCLWILMWIVIYYNDFLQENYQVNFNFGFKNPIYFMLLWLACIISYGVFLYSDKIPYLRQWEQNKLIKEIDRLKRNQNILDNEHSKNRNYRR
ncbi:hypothetical protein [Myroides sp. LJL119]